MKIITVNSKTKHKSRTMLGVIMKTSSWFYYLLCYCIYEKVPIHVTSAQGTAQNALYISWKRKLKIFYDKQFTKVATHKKCSKLLKWKMIQSTYNINTQCNLLFAEKKWNCNSIWNKSKLFCDVNKICGVLRNEWRATKWVIYGMPSF